VGGVRHRQTEFIPVPASAGATPNIQFWITILHCIQMFIHKQIQRCSQMFLERHIKSHLLGMLLNSNVPLRSALFSAFLAELQGIDSFNTDCISQAFFTYFSISCSTKQSQMNTKILTCMQNLSLSFAPILVHNLCFICEVTSFHYFFDFKLLLQCRFLEDKNRLFQNVGKKLPVLAA
jgi:hypothetical protein